MFAFATLRRELSVNELNEAVEAELRALRIGGWGRGYVGRPILITQNHPPTGLVNGDIGIIGRDQQVYFENRNSAVDLSILPPHRTVFAMSIHKSQGSEFQKIIMCIPPRTLTNHDSRIDIYRLNQS